ncbi:TetR/AcrR family transcriptional regulator [Nocardia speluncae]|uniref:TetR/AcrR family transcriptional regulator n=1 Tax=Nocardia speluncae TaxID=419477 RepID=A0A846XH12_9NOCA|nr:TetR/AcrR family transcriptional regulator [Nocardia speluncae]NKY33893.1 TetR/AcrR family transcriptional regulator [Nocardia speluncae]
MNLATTAPRPRRLRVDAARNQQRILDAARELFADRGLEITLDDVAARAGVGVGTVYRRFANKRELISEVFAVHVREFAEAAQDALTEANPWEGVVRLFDYACRHMATNRGFSEVMLAMHDDPDRLTLPREQLGPAVAAVMERARNAGVLQPGIEDTDLFALIYMVDSLAEFARPVDSDIWRRYMAITLNGIRAQDTPPQPLAVNALSLVQVERAKAAKPCVARRR